MTNDIIFGTLIAANGKSTFKGLFDKKGNPVKLVLEKDGDEILLAAFANNNCTVYHADRPTDCGISDEEIDRVCKEQDSAGKTAFTILAKIAVDIDIPEGRQIFKRIQINMGKNNILSEIHFRGAECKPVTPEFDSFDIIL